MTDFDWLTLPIETRGIFGELVKLAGIGYPRGVIKGSDEAIAAGLRVETPVLTRAIDRLATKPHRSLRRRADGICLVNWDKYQAPAMAISHAQRGEPPYREKSREEGDKTERTHALLEGYDLWVAQPRDARRLDALTAKYPTLDLADELSDFMAYADRRAAKGNAYVDYIAAFSNHCKSQFEYHKKRGWGTPGRLVVVAPPLAEQLARLKAK
jgi:hypothetical protein